jgi:putative transposase
VAGLKSKCCNLELFAEKWDKQYPSISRSGRSHWQHIIPFFAYPPEIRKVIYTTNAIESMNSSLGKVIKSKQIFLPMTLLSN